MSRLQLLTGFGLLFISLLFFSCSGKDKQFDPPPFNPDHSRFISAYTYGVMKRDKEIVIVFNDYVATGDQVGKEADASLLEFDPEIKGKARWTDRRTLSFKPDAFLPTGQVFDGELDLKILYDTVSSKLRYFPFQFVTLPQTLHVKTERLTPVYTNQIQWYQIKGTADLTEREYPEKVKKVLNVKAGDRSLPVKWMSSDTIQNYAFVIDSIERKEKAYEVEFHWSGKEVDATDASHSFVTIPALGDFSITKAEAFNDPEQYFQLEFSDPLLTTQNLQGLIRCSNTSLSFVIENNVIKGYPTQKLLGEQTIIVSPGIRNVMNARKSTSDTLRLTFVDMKPNVRSAGNGVIIPGGGQIPFVFEAVNLSAVDVRITKIYENNILEFLQFNDLNGNSHIRYVGKELIAKKIELNADPTLSLGKWNRHAIDLTSLVKTEPGAIYRVEVRFRKEYSLYGCIKQETAPQSEGASLYEKPFWIYDDHYGYCYGDDCDPCEENYYWSNEGVVRNVLASDLGMLTKKGTDNSYLVVVTDLKTAIPLAGVPVQVYDFQRQLITSGITNEEGILKFKTGKEVFVLMASKGAQRGYLKIQYNALSMSRFMVSGNTYQKGLKGFLYTDRGVWRPGDSIYVSFILEDPLRVLPPAYPVVFELINPRGQVIHKLVNKNPLNGFYSFPTFTDLNAPTGSYSARVNIGGVYFEKSIKVETIIPNRLKLEMDFNKEFISTTDKQFATLKVRWLHGAGVSNLSTDISANFRRINEPFPAYKEYKFYDEDENYVSEAQTVFDGNLDEEGKIELSHDWTLKSAMPGVMKTNFFCKVYEPGGNFSTDYFSTVYYPYNSYVGVKLPKDESDVYEILLTDKDNTIDIVTIDKDGKPVSEEVEVELSRLSWVWWWDYYEESSGYYGRTVEEVVKKEKLMSVDGKLKWNVRVDSRRSGRYLITAKLKNGHTVSKVTYIENPGWYYRRPEESTGTTLLSFTSNKEKYVKGEQVTLEIPTGFAGRALITIEKGGQVLKTDWIDAVKGKTFYRFTATSDMAPNVYANVMLFQPHAQTENDLPIRMYGVVPIMVDDPASHLEPLLTMPKVLRPEEKVSIQVREKNGKAMTYTIAMVDEGLLDLTKFKTPNPWNEFYAKQALEVQTYDLYDYVMGNNSKGLKKLLSIGGDGSNEPGQGSKVQRFKPMVKFIGPFYLPAGGSTTHSFVMPKYIGSVRTMIVAGQHQAYGCADNTTPVKKPLMVLGTLPRVLGPNEEVTLPVSVFAEENIKEATVQIQANELFTITSVASQQVTFTKNGEYLVNFSLKVKPAVGVGKVTIKAFSGNEKASFDIELDVRATNPYVTNNIPFTLPSGGTKTIPFTNSGITGTNKATMELSYSPLMNLNKHLSYLIEYPHGCVEQTTSSVFPQLSLADVVNLTAKEKSEVEKNIKAGIKRLQLFQQSDGGFSYWPEDYYGSDEWGSNYAGHFLFEANRKGYYVPSYVLTNWKSYLRKKANEWNPEQGDYDDRTQGYRLYLLSLAGAPEYGAMNRMKESVKVNLVARWYLAAAYAVAGQKSTATTMTNNLPVIIEQYRELSYTYGSDKRDRAILLQLMTKLGRIAQADQMFVQLTKELSSDVWYSTQETAYSLLAISDYMLTRSTGKEFNLTYRINSGEWKTVAGKQALQQIKLEVGKFTKGTLEIKNNGIASVYGNLALRGIPLSGEEKFDDKGMVMTVEYTDRNGKAIDVTRLEQGTEFIAEIRVSASSEYESIEEVALNFMVASGWEIHNARFYDEVTAALPNSEPDFMDIRDDRIYYYFDLKDRIYSYSDERDDYDNDGDNERGGGKSKIFRVMLNATYQGKFYLPSTYTEAMYDHTINAGEKGKWVEVVAPKKPL